MPSTTKDFVMSFFSAYVANDCEVSLIFQFVTKVKQLMNEQHLVLM